MKTGIILLSIATLITLSLAFTAERTSIAVLTFKAEEIPADLANRISELILKDLTSTGKYTIFDQEMINRKLSEQKEPLSGCTHIACAARIGRMLSTQKVLFGTVKKTKNTFLITGNIFTVSTGSSYSAITQEFNSDDNFYSRIALFINKLKNRLKSTDEKNESTSIINKTGDMMTIGGVEFVYIEGGAFTMGSPDHEGEHDEHPSHRVILDAFWVGRYEVTQSQYEAVTGKNPSGFVDKNKPVESINFIEVIEFCTRFSNINKKKVRLPYEAEWEYACRAGSNTIFFWGEQFELAPKYSNFADKNIPDEYNDKSSEYDDGFKYTAPVGSLHPNKWGLYDMIGNVFEWCMDEYDSEYYTKSPRHNPVSSISGANPVTRGGSWASPEKQLRPAYRSKKRRNTHSLDLGFRLVIPAKK